MHSIFTRARTTSSKNLPRPPPHDSQGIGPDEFGRVNSRGLLPATPPKPPKHKDKDKRQRTTSNAQDARRAAQAAVSAVGDGSFDETPLEDGFFPTSIGQPDPSQQQYGYLSHENHVVLGVEDVTKLVEIVADELSARGLTTPFLFSNTALDISTHAVRRLISSFLFSVSPSLTSAHGVSKSDFREEAKFAGPHDLGMVLRWGLARIVRVVHGLECRGLIGWDVYITWRGIEQDSNYSRTEFTSLLSLLPVQVRSLILTLFTLLARLLANSTSSGLTPPTLSALFGPLLFGLGAGTQATGSFHAAYTGYLRACHATEHALLSFVRLQVAQTSPSSPPPRRLLSWVQGYPAMLVPLEALERPRRGVKTVRVASVRRNVRLYSPDLIRTCAEWAKGAEGAGMRSSREWERITPPIPGDRTGERMPPRFSDVYRKKLDLPASFHPYTGAGDSTLSTPGLSPSSSTTSTKSSLLDDLDFGLGLREENRFRSLTDAKWGEFQELGFGDGDTKKLQFDLNESARSERSAKRTTLTWADFSSAGFTRTEQSLSATLQFSAPLSATITQWPNMEKDLHRKLKKSQKTLPAFGWDTAPVMDGREEIVEEAFVDCFCDLLYGGGWMDRSEGTFRECSWALVEFKSLSTNGTNVKRSTDSKTHDPRTSTTLFLFEEFVPFEYRVSLTSTESKPRTRLASLLSPNKKTNKQWKPAPTLNGRPYVVGTVPRSPNAREAEFERLLAGGGGAVTRVITLDAATGGRLNVKPPGDVTPKQSISGPLFVPPAASQSTPVKGSTSAAVSPSGTSLASPLSGTSSTKTSRFRFPVGSRGAANRQGMLIPSEYDTVDFETRLASYSDDELNDERGGKTGRKAKRMSKDDAWVDILVASHEKRITGQDAELRTTKSNRGLAVSGGSGGRSDPELASKEVAQALAAVRQHPPTDDEAEIDWDGHRERARREREAREMEIELAKRREIEAGQSSRAQVPGDGDEFIPPVPRKKVGYFDLHPERRRGDGLDDEHDSQLYPHGYTPVDPNVSIRSSDYAVSDRHGNSFYSESDFEPADSVVDAERQIDGDIEVPAFVDDPAELHHRRELEHGHAKTESAILPPSLSVTGQSKTAALIELYRERERQQDVNSPTVPAVSPSSSAGSVSAPKPSRLPVRMQALRTEFDEDDELPAPKDRAALDQTQVPFGLDELGRASPMRYIHGAPLHNVLEEEEEN